jgi:hypothetical protein
MMRRARNWNRAPSLSRRGSAIACPL